MDHYLILARSVTYAQRMQRAMARTGIRSQIFRAPRDLTDAGCAYALRVAEGDLSGAVRAIYGASLGPVRIFWNQNGAYQEVRV